MIKPMYMNGDLPGKPIGFVPVDDWNPTSPEDNIFTVCKGSVLLPITQCFGITKPELQNLNVFVISSKRCYNGDAMRDHLHRYMNYFEKFYDPDHELIMNMAMVKVKIDTVPVYDVDMFKYDLQKYIFCESLCNKAVQMVEDNYTLSLDSKNYENAKNPALVYKDRHTKILLWMSLLQNMCIPLITHYIYQDKTITDANEFILDIFNIILGMSDVDMFNKLYETSISSVNRNSMKHERLWLKQDIRGKTQVTHALESVQNIILNIMPKYVYTMNIISFNYTSIKKNIHYQVTGIEFEYDYVPLSSSIRDADSNSVFDKYESFLPKANESLLIQNKVSCEATMKQIRLLFGPITNEEIAFYMQRMDDGEGNVINEFQRTLIFQLFAKYFGDPYTERSINKINYIELVIAATRYLLANNMWVLPYVISSKMDRVQNKKNINKKEQTRIENSPLYPKIVEKYQSTAVIDQIFGIIGTILASRFEMISFTDPNIDGKYLDKDRFQEIVCDEVLMYVLLI